MTDCEQEASYRLHLATFGKGNLFFDQISKFRTHWVRNNIKMKAYVAMIVHNLKALYSEPDPKFDKNLKNCKENVRDEVGFQYNCRYVVSLLELDCSNLYLLLIS